MTGKIITVGYDIIYTGQLKVKRDMGEWEVTQKYIWELDLYFFVKIEIKQDQIFP